MANLAVLMALMHSINRKWLHIQNYCIFKLHSVLSCLLLKFLSCCYRGSTTQYQNSSFNCCNTATGALKRNETKWNWPTQFSTLNSKLCSTHILCLLAISCPIQECLYRDVQRHPFPVHLTIRKLTFRHRGFSVKAKERKKKREKNYKRVIKDLPLSRITLAAS